MFKVLLSSLLTNILFAASSDSQAAGIIYDFEGSIGLCNAPCNIAPDKWPNLNRDKDIARLLHEGGTRFIVAAAKSLSIPTLKSRR